jgi:hypothetical protein
MSKREPPSRSLFGPAILPGLPLNPLALWLKAQAGAFATMRQLTDRWYERRVADIALLQETADGLANFENTGALLEAHGRCASALVERFIADMSDLQDSWWSLRRSAGDGLGGGPPKPHDGRSKVAAE